MLLCSFSTKLRAEDIDCAGTGGTTKCIKCQGECDAHACTLCLLTRHPECASSQVGFVKGIGSEQLGVIDKAHAAAVRDLPQWMQVFLESPVEHMGSSASNSLGRTGSLLGPAAILQVSAYFCQTGLWANVKHLSKHLNICGGLTGPALCAWKCCPESRVSLEPNLHSVRLNSSFAVGC